MGKQYSKISNIVDVIEWTGANENAITGFMSYCALDMESRLMVKTHGGVLKADIGDFIIKDGEGKFHLYDADTFKELYKEVAHLESMNDHLETELDAIRSVLQELGFSNGIDKID